ncbi:DUF2079 domain-containing protein [Myxacorys almedinensis A]|uniref:DUF2079 domain-containing protein n=1 Tax=Myxacorys almedinensis A TaxID=2690445 RepID=A0A8J7Z0W2_9CYAN|nr:DUF2079 domain-containing protein [Myxacorys almedinensis A]
MKFPAAFKLLLPKPDQLGLKRALWLAAIFFCGVLLLALHRYFTFYASYDHGLFNQLFWNTSHGRWFQSSLTSANSIATLADGATPTVSFVHLGQHLVLDFLLWLPLYRVFPHPVTLIVLQVGLMAAGGLVLYGLARHYLAPQLSLWIVGSYYSAIAVVSPTLANFYEHCQIPLFAFGTLLAMEKQRWGWFWLGVLLVLGIREEAGIILFGIGAYLIVSRRHPRIGVAVCVLSFSYVAFVTTVIMPSFSADSSRLYLATRFAQYVDSPNPSTLQVLWGILTHPAELVSSLFLPFDRKIGYLIGHWLPLAFVPALSGVSWLVAGFPLLSLMLQKGMSALSMQLRYAIAVVPGIFYGAIVWWSHHPDYFTAKVRNVWKGCLIVSFVVILTSNPNRSLSFLIPDSVRPWVFVPITRQWEHATHLYSVLKAIPQDASVSATTYLIPHVSTRRAVVRLPQIEIYDDRGDKTAVDYAIADIWQLAEYSKAFADSRTALSLTVPKIDKLVATNKYGLLHIEDGIVLLGKNQPSHPEALTQWALLLKRIGWQAATTADLARSAG